MRVDIQFVNFPKSDLIREIVVNRIQECCSKFSRETTSIKVFFKTDGLEHYVKIALKASHLSACINASSPDCARAIEKAIQKLEAFLRRFSSKQKHKKTLHLTGEEGLEISRYRNRFSYLHENLSERYEQAYSSDFEYI